MENFTVPKAAPRAAYYSAAWTECGRLITCGHQHGSVGEAVPCIQSAGGYVVAIEANVMRCLTAGEEVEFQCAVHPLCTKSCKPVRPEPLKCTPCHILRRAEGETLVEFVLRFFAMQQEAEDQPHEDSVASQTQKLCA